MLLQLLMTVYPLTCWCRKLYIYNTQRDAQNSRHKLNMAPLIQPLCKFQSSTEHTRHLIQHQQVKQQDSYVLKVPFF
jgi:hypothetical protein